MGWGCELLGIFYDNFCAEAFLSLLHGNKTARDFFYALGRFALSVNGSDNSVFLPFCARW